MDKLFVNMSAGQETTFGKILFQLYYMSGRNLLDLAPGSSGYPHNGGAHTLHLRAEKGDVLAFFDLVEEMYPKAKPALDNLREQINQGLKRVHLPRNFE